MDKLEHLKNQRTGQKAYVKKIINEFKTNKIEAASLISIINSRKTKISELNDNIVAGITEAQAIQTEIARQNEYEEELEEALRLAEKSLSTANISNTTPQTSGPPTTRVNLPKIQLKKFSGNLLDWQNFWETFEHTIHKANYLNKIEKFNYLLSYLEGPAFRAIKGLSITEQNYDSAVKILRDRYGDLQVIINSHMDKLLSVRTVQASDLKSLRGFYDFVTIHIRSLEGLGYDEDKYGGVLLPLLLKKLPKDLKLRWADKCGQTQWKFSDLISFLEKEIHTREKVEVSEHRDNIGSTGVSKNPKKESNNNFKENTQSSSFLAASKNSNNGTFKYICVYCGERHKSQFCKKYTAVEERRNLIKKENLCFGCLKKGHLVTKCSWSCPICKGKHHVSICSSGGKPSPNNSANYKAPTKSTTNTNVIIQQTKMNENVSAQTPKTDTTIVTSQVSPSSTKVLLQTARIPCLSNYNTSYTINALFDKGSHKSYVTEDLASRMKFHKIQKEVRHVNTFGTTECILKKSQLVEIPIKSKKGVIHITALTVPVICADISQSCSSQGYKNLQGLDLSNANVTGKIDMLIGCDWYWDLVTGKVRNAFSGPVAMSSKVGWLISGKLSNENAVTGICIACTCGDSTEIDLSSSMDCVGVSDTHLEPEAQEFVEEFYKNLKFDGSNYSAKLPWRTGLLPINNNFWLSRKRLENLVKSLKSKNLFERYHQVFDDYEEKNYIERVTDMTTGRFYLPHHAVLKEERSSTKVRVVFDGSAKSCESLSLNECLYKGPSLMVDLSAALTRFRLKPIVITGDLKEAFLQVEIHQDDRDWLRFLWKNNEGELICYRFRRLPFGLSCSPFVLNAVVMHHLLKQSSITHESFYVDDLILPVDSVAEGAKKSQDLASHMKTAGFYLHKWATNKKELADNLQVALGESTVLGIKWKHLDDVMMLEVNNLAELLTKEVITKRSALSAISQIFDPLGLFSCVTINLRIFFQTLNYAKMDWNAELEEKQRRELFQLITDAQLIGNIPISRLLYKSTPDALQIHIYTDASSKAYGACAYIRYHCELGWRSTLLCTKARIMPLKPLTIPRLELTAAVEGARLYKRICEISSQFADCPVTVWSDSVAALRWITGTKQWPVYIENRVKVIRQMNLTNCYKYVNTKNNPADIISRGAKVKDILNNNFWWQGPKILLSDQTHIPEDNYKSTDNETEVPKFEEVLITNTTNLEFLMRFGSWNKLVRVFAYVLRFVNNSKPGTQKLKNTLELKEVKQAQTLLHRLEQQHYFPQEYAYLLKKLKTSPVPTMITQLDLFIDEDKIIKLRTRLHYSSLPSSAKNPVLLSSKGHLVKLLVNNSHRLTLHSGVEQTLANLRLKYWLIKGRRVVKAILRSCVTCKKVVGKSFPLPIQPQLPEFRVQSTLPFLNIGIDYAGPVDVKANLTNRKSSTIKAYICLFTCATCRGIHLEMVLDLTTNSFIAAFRRFVSRRGLPSKIYSDNGTTFVSSAKSIATVISGKTNDNALIDICLEHGITWDFIVPRASWWGGFYERMVGLVKKCLRKVVGRALITYLEFETTLIQIEGVINTRPLTYISENFIDGEVITPNHLILGRQEHDNHFESVSDSTIVTVQTRREHQNTIIRQFWNKFQKEYLLSLRERNTQKIMHGTEPQKGDVVLLQDQLPRSMWRLGLIENLIKGHDGHVRAAELRLPPRGQQGTKLTRSIKHLIPLEINCSGTSKTLTGTSSASLSVSKLITLLSILLLLFCQVLAIPNVGPLCKDLSCYQEHSGILTHYDIYDHQEWKQQVAYVCSRVKTSCQYYKYFGGTNWHRCTSHFVVVSRGACLLWASNKQTPDGVLKRVSKHMSSTGNQVHPRYTWLATNVDEKWNVFVERHLIRVNGTNIETSLELKEGKCGYDSGFCPLYNKTLAWDNKWYCPMEYSRSEMCHHRGSEVMCSESDFDTIRKEIVCGKMTHRTVQGSYLVVNTSSVKLTVRRHRLNAAVIQHLSDRVASLERKLECMSQNLYCQKLNLTVPERRGLFSEFYVPHEKIDTEEGQLDTEMKDQERIVENEEVDYNDQSSYNFLSKLPKWIKGVAGTVFAVFGVGALVVLVKFCFIPMLTCLVAWIPACCKRQNQGTEGFELAEVENSERSPLTGVQTTKFEATPLRRVYSMENVAGPSSGFSSSPIKLKRGITLKEPSMKWSRRH